jgi:hypothetical protein
MNAGVTFERVYFALKDLLGSARFAAGHHLEPAALSQDLNVSITPVRDALHRLAGEGLVDTSRGEGFRTPAVTEVGLRHLYRWNAALLDLAVRARGGPGAPVRVAEGDSETTPGPIETTERLFLAVAERTGSPEHLAAIVGLNDRLRRVRQTELAVLVEPLAELEPIAAQLAEDAVLALRRSLSTYHRRRERLVGEIVASLAVPH